MKSVLIALATLLGWSIATEAQTPYDCVNPLIGTQRMGHVYPGATVPFGSVQLSPDTRYLNMYQQQKYVPEAYAYCAGYQYDDTTIYGFSHTHFSGTGHSDLGDFLLLPLSGKPNWDSILKGQERPYHRFTHSDETAKAGYYRVKMGSPAIQAELTATPRVGIHRYTFPEGESAHLLLDLVYNIYNYEGKNIWSFVRVENDSTLTGYRQTAGWGRTRTEYFAMRLSAPISEYGFERMDQSPYQGFYRKFNERRNFPEMAGKDLRLFLSFEPANQPLVVKMALSSVSTASALRNLEVEGDPKSFDNAVIDARNAWTQELEKVKVETLSKSDRISFYTALYHTMLSPTIYEDVDGNYKGLDQNVHQSTGFTNYTVFSLWDTYRSLHPWFNIHQPARNQDMVKSMLAHAEQSVHGMLPIWSHYANENWCMIGYHAVSVLADALVKQGPFADPKELLKWSHKTAQVPYFDGVGAYRQLGYVPEDKSGNSASKTLEYAYDDWCISVIAERAQNDSLQSYYRKASEQWTRVYDPLSGYVRPKLANGNFKPDFDPLDTHGQGFIEGNALNYGLYVPQDIKGMVTKMGGEKAFRKRLDYLFEIELADKYIEKNEDITRDGLMGAYVHGNEPGHHIPYLYLFTDQPFKTAQRVRQILREKYLDKPDGLCGNDDAGQMSAWYLFSALGFYPITPGSDEYVIGSPLVKSAEIQLDGGKSFRIQTVNQSEKNIYVKSIRLNGRKLENPVIKHEQLINGGVLTFEMSPTP